MREQFPHLTRFKDVICFSRPLYTLINLTLTSVMLRSYYFSKETSLSTGAPSSGTEPNRTEPVFELNLTLSEKRPINECRSDSGIFFIVLTSQVAILEQNRSLVKLVEGF